MNCPKCPNDHLLMEAIVVMADHFCDVCYGTLHTNLVHRCEQCDHDVCGACYELEIKNLVELNISPIKLKTIG